MDVEYRGRKTGPYSSLMFIIHIEKKLNIFCVGLENNIIILKQQQYHNLLFTQERSRSPFILCLVIHAPLNFLTTNSSPSDFCLYCLWTVDECNYF